MIPTTFIFLPTILCDYYYCADFVYSNNDKIVFATMPESMCFVSKCINSTEMMMVILCNMCELSKLNLRGCLQQIVLYFYISVQ